MDENVDEKVDDKWMKSGMKKWMKKVDEKKGYETVVKLIKNHARPIIRKVKKT